MQYNSLMLVQVLPAKPATLPPVAAVGKPTVHQVLHVDTSDVAMRLFKEDALSRYRTDPAFNYRTDHIDGGDTWWDRFWYWLWHLINNLFGNSSAPDTGHSAPYTKYIVLALLIGLLLYVFIRYIRKNMTGILNKESTSISLTNTELSENIHEINFDDNITQAIQQQNYKLAVRLLYLRTLKQLSDAQIIYWRAEKTNSAYLLELSNADQKRMFSKLTYQFEYIWYGNFPVGRQAFQNVYTLFQEFKKLVP